MPLFEISADEGLVPFRQLRGGAELYESEIEELLWSDLESFTGESLFPIKKQANIQGGGRPDIVALDGNANVVIIEVKRDVDRAQLAQCLEYAGWGRSTSLDELAGLYHRGAGQFFADWADFTDSDAPVVLTRTPRLILVARDFHGRTESAFQFLAENGLPVSVIRVAVYVDEQGRRFVDVEGDHEPEIGVSPKQEDSIDYTRLNGRAIKVPDLLDAGLIEAGEAVEWIRPKLGKSYAATVQANGSIELSDGRVFGSVSRAAVEAAGIPAFDGWYAWTVVRLGKKLHELRKELHKFGPSDE